MNKKLSLNHMLHNQKFVLVFSILAAIAIWAAVSYGPSNIVEKTITGVPIDITLTNGIVKEEDLRVVGNKEFTANVKVRGSKSVVDTLTPDKIYLKADTSGIAKPGVFKDQAVIKPVNIDYEIVDLSVTSITLECDKWVTTTFPVEADIATIKTTDDKNFRLGTPLIEAAYLKDGAVSILGPSQQIAKIEKMVARVQEEQTISDVQVFPAALKALDAQGAEVDLTECTIVDAEGKEITSSDINVTVPVQVYKKVTFTYKLEHVPDYYKDFFSLSPKYIEFWGSPATAEAFAASVADLGSFDFDNLKPSDTTKTIALNIPDGITVLNNVKEVTASFDFRGADTKSFDLTLDTGAKGNVTILNKPANRTVTIAPDTKLSGVTICGPKATLNRIKAADLQVTIDMAGNTTTGPSRCWARITVKNRSNVWAYYGSSGEEGVEVWVTVDIA